MKIKERIYIARRNPRTFRAKKSGSHVAPVSTRIYATRASKGNYRPAINSHARGHEALPRSGACFSPLRVPPLYIFFPCEPISTSHSHARGESYRGVCANDAGGVGWSCAALYRCIADPSWVCAMLCTCRMGERDKGIFCARSRRDVWLFIGL